MPRPKFNDRALPDSAAGSATAAPKSAFSATEGPEVVERFIGQLMVQARTLSAAQVDQVLAYQRRHGVRFGDAAVALRVARREDVLHALASQFAYAYTTADGAGLNSELFMANHPFSEEVETFRDLRSQLLMTVLAPTDKRRAVAVVSANIGDGKSFIASNLAVAFSQLPGRTVLVDADMRTPRMQEVFGLVGSHGLSTLLSGNAGADMLRTVRGLPNLYVLPVGTVPPNPLELLQRSEFSLLMHELVSKFDHVLIDTPAAAHGSDARLVAARAGAALMVSRRNHTNVKPAHTLLAQLSKAQVAMAGVVMNDY